MEKELMRVVIAHTSRVEVKDIPNTLEALQKIVGGNIEVFRAFADKDIVTICNEEGYLLNLKPNKYFPGIVGNVVICGVNGEEFTSISTEKAKKLARLLG